MNLSPIFSDDFLIWVVAVTFFMTAWVVRSAIAKTTMDRRLNELHDKLLDEIEERDSMIASRDAYIDDLLGDETLDNRTGSEEFYAGWNAGLRWASTDSYGFDYVKVRWESYQEFISSTEE